MVSFDLEVFFLQLVIFIFFLIFTSRFIVKPVTEMSEKRKNMLLQEKASAEKIETEAVDFRETYKSGISSIHKEGKTFLNSAKEKAVEDRSSFVRSEKAKTDQFLANKRSELNESGKTLTAGLKEKEEELVSLISAKLWGGK